ncbi:hypothetical protein M422DRAFT_147943, partial [Sphaerobolus stellatus SS14]
EYERVAKQKDEEFLERYNSDLDVQLIFAGLFSVISSAFIVQMERNLQADPNARTNALLAFLVQQSIHNVSLPLIPWAGPGLTMLWTQALAHASLGLSLLAAFGAVLGKQW